MRLFKRKNNSVSKWRLKAMLVDPKKTRITFCVTMETRHMPPWMHRRLEEST